MKERLLTGWNFRRLLYLIMGLVVIVQSSIDQRWLFTAFGCYFAAMGLFAFGCASGNCATPFTADRKDSLNRDVEFEEVGEKKI